jgi:predicted metal-dependent hydrolase
LLGITGIAFGAYVLGTRAGRGRYREIRAAAETIWNDPRIKKAREKAVNEADRAAHAALDQVKKIGR